MFGAPYNFPNSNNLNSLCVSRIPQDQEEWETTDGEGDESLAYSVGTTDHSTSSSNVRTHTDTGHSTSSHSSDSSTDSAKSGTTTSSGTQTALTQTPPRRQYHTVCSHQQWAAFAGSQQQRYIHVDPPAIGLRSSARQKVRKNRVRQKVGYNLLGGNNFSIYCVTL